MNLLRQDFEKYLKENNLKVNTKLFKVVDIDFGEYQSIAIANVAPFSIPMRGMNEVKYNASWEHSYDAYSQIKFLKYWFGLVPADADEKIMLEYYKKAEKQERDLDKMLTKEELLRCKYEGIEKGWTLDGRKLVSHRTELGNLSYRYGYGYVLGDFDNGTFEKLGDFISRHGIECRTEEVIRDLERFKEKEKEKQEKEEKKIQLEKEKRDSEQYKSEPIPDGYFECWECGRIMPIEKQQADGTCGC